jgi:hypothetical protein
MKGRTVLLTAILFCAVSFSVYTFGEGSVADKGTWPKTWPEELEPLRETSRSLQGGELNLIRYEVPFNTREEFEAAWPHILKVKTKGAPLFLVRGPYKPLGNVINAGVIIHCPPPQTGDQVMPEAPLPGDPKSPGRWVYTNFIEVVVDADVVDLNRIPLPADTPIIDVRFEDGITKR